MTDRSPADEALDRLDERAAARALLGDASGYARALARWEKDRPPTAKRASKTWSQTDGWGEVSGVANKKLAPTVELLQLSAVLLVERMCGVGR